MSSWANAIKFFPCLGSQAWQMTWRDSTAGDQGLCVCASQLHDGSLNAQRRDASSPWARTRQNQKMPAVHHECERSLSEGATWECGFPENANRVRVANSQGATAGPCINVCLVQKDRSLLFGRSNLGKSGPCLVLLCPSEQRGSAA